MIFPIGDTQVKGGHKPLFTYTFIVLNILIFALQVSQPGNLICEFAVMPENIRNGTHLYTLLTSLFMHGSYMHIIGNLLFLWVFADNIEAVIGNFRFVVFYLGGGVVASLAHIYLGTPAADTLPCCMPCDGCDGPCDVCRLYSLLSAPAVPSLRLWGLTFCSFHHLKSKCLC
jgi:membrane associated rhomboid family serine protease